MKTFYSTWNKDNIDDSVIVKNIKEMSGGKLEIDLDRVRAENLFDSNIRERNQEKEAGGSTQNMRNRNQKGRGGKPHYKKRRN